MFERIELTRFRNSVALPMQQQHELEDRIAGGSATTIDKFPHQVSFRAYGQHICGAAILTTKHVITAAVCVVDPRDPLNHSVVAGSTTLAGDTNKQIRVAIRLIKHPDHKPVWPVQTNYDIAIVTVAGYFEFNQYVQAIKLPEAGVIPEQGVSVTLSGWGKPRIGEPLANELQQVSMSVVNPGNCEAVYGRLFFKRESMLCVGSEHGGKGSCEGDRGSPLTLGGRLVGIVGFEKDCGVKGDPSVFARVSQYVDWISKTITEKLDKAE